MLENPSIQRYLQGLASHSAKQLLVSNNPTGADNQQERLIPVGIRILRDHTLDASMER